MEAVPRMPMLSVELKISNACPDFGPPFKKIIVKYYGEDGDQYDREIHELETLRNQACRAVKDFTGLSLLKRYYAQLYSLYNRFTMFQDPIGVQCVWADIYKGESYIGDLNFEMACILYNIGSLHSTLGGLEDRVAAEEMKVCCTHFQCAAWAFQHLMENNKLHRSSDMCSDLLAFFVQIMLAQAHECILEKSMLDNRKAKTVAAVTAQVVEHYQSAISMLQQGAINTTSTSSIIEVVEPKLFKEWQKFLDFKLKYYMVVCHLYNGNICEEQQNKKFAMGERISWYESANERMKEVIKLAKKLESYSDCIESVNFVADVITVKLNNAKKENDFIYQEKVPPVETLTEVKGTPLVKGIAFSVTDPEICVKDIFQRLVPIEAHETASLYSAQKDELARNIRHKIEDANQELASFLSSLPLDGEALHRLLNNGKLIPDEQVPDELIDICAELSLIPDAVDEVEETLKRLDTVSKDVGKIITELKSVLNEEEEKEKQHQERFGKRPPSLIMVELAKELTKHEETHNKATQSNRSLWENFDHHKEDIRVMTSSSAVKIANILPSSSEVPYDKSLVTEMLHVFEKIDEMKQQRVQLEEQLIQKVNQDDVLKLVLAHPKETINSVFEQEIKKYDSVINWIQMNLDAQPRMLSKLTELNANYADTYKAIVEVTRERKTRIASLMYAYQVFKELQTNSKKGLEFYEKFCAIVTRLCARIRGVTKVLDEERAQFVIAQEKPKLIPSMSAVMPTGGSIMAPPSISNQMNGSFSVSAATISAPALSTSPLPTIPATGAKLKDYLPYMKQAKLGATSVAAIPAANYVANIPSSNAVSAGIGPLSVNYPPQNSVSLPVFAPSVPIPSSTSIPAYSLVPSNQQPITTVANPAQNYFPSGTLPIASSVATSPCVSSGYASHQVAAQLANISQHQNYSPPPSYSQAIASTVSYSLPTIISTISPIMMSTSPTGLNMQTNLTTPHAPQLSYQPSPSVMPIQHSQKSQVPVPHSSVYSGAPTPIQHPSPVTSSYFVDHNSMVQPNYCNASFPSVSGTQQIMPPSNPPPQQSKQLTASYYYPASVIGPRAPNPVNSHGQSSPVVSTSYTQVGNHATYYGTTTSQLPATAPVTPYLQQSHIPSQPTQVYGQQQQFVQQPVIAQHPVSIAAPGYHQMPNGTSYATVVSPQQPAVMNNSVAATIQAIETESKLGWPVLTPTKMNDNGENGSKTVSDQSAKVNGQANVTETSKVTANGSDQLPDILATMSISNNTTTPLVVSSSTGNVAQEENKTMSSSTAPTNASVANQNNNSNTSGSDDLLSQFDPLFT